MDLNRTAKESTDAAGSSMRGRNFGGVGGFGVEGGQVCGIGEQVIRAAMVVENVRLMRIRKWTWRVP